MCESLGQQRQRVSHEVELVWSDALAAVGSDGQGVPLSVDAEELQVEEAGSEPTLQGATLATSYGATWSNRHWGGGEEGGKKSGGLTACRMALLWRRDSISRAVRACSATSMNWIT